MLLAMISGLSHLGVRCFCIHVRALLASVCNVIAPKLRLCASAVPHQTRQEHAQRHSDGRLVVYFQAFFVLLVLFWHDHNLKKSFALYIVPFATLELGESCSLYCVRLIMLAVLCRLIMFAVLVLNVQASFDYIYVFTKLLSICNLYFRVYTSNLLLQAYIFVCSVICYNLTVML